MQIDEKKLERQQLGVHKWFNSSQYGSTKDRNGAFDYFTGVGKTFTAIIAIKKLKEIELESFHTTIIVPSEALQKQWVEVLNKHFIKKDINLIDVYTVNYILENKLIINTDLLILDELHEYYTTERFKIVDRTYIRYRWLIGLTATYKDINRRYKKMLDYCPIIDTINEQEALKEGYISRFVEYNVGLELTEEEKLQYDNYTKIIAETMPKFGKWGLELATKCLSGGKHNNGIKYPAKHFVYGWAAYNGWHKNLNLANPTDIQIDELWNPNKIFGYAVKLMNSIRARTNLLYDTQEKLEATVELINKFNQIKTIVFSQSTDFADKVGIYTNIDKLTTVVYHSKLSSQMMPSEKTGKLIKYGAVRLKRRAIDYIRNGTARVISTASSLDKGFDVEDIRMAITASGTQNFTQYKQRGGRAKRKEILNPDIVVLIINLYIKNTKDEDWLRKRQSTSNHTIHWVDSIDEVTYTPTPNNEFKLDDL